MLISRGFSLTSNSGDSVKCITLKLREKKKKKNACKATEDSRINKKKRKEKKSYVTYSEWTMIF